MLDLFSVCSENIFKPDDPKSLLKGMKGYQLTPDDLDFIEKMKGEKLIKKLQVMSAFSLRCSCCLIIIIIVQFPMKMSGWWCNGILWLCSQGDLEEVQRLLKNETMALELTLASREKAQAELNKVSLFELYVWIIINKEGDKKMTYLQSVSSLVTNRDVFQFGSILTN